MRSSTVSISSSGEICTRDTASTLLKLRLERWVAELTMLPDQLFDIFSFD
nr:MAG TPA: hypothetical protein [Caudoviricetes sp.]